MTSSQYQFRIRIRVVACIAVYSTSFCLFGLLGDRCEAPPLLDNTNLDFTSTNDLAVADYSCQFGHRFTDGTVFKQLRCEGGQWVGDATSCSGKHHISTLNIYKNLLDKHYTDDDA